MLCTMIENNYKIGKTISDKVKYNIAYDRTQILNYVCVNYVYDILTQGDTFNINDE
jgi:hypothetical protein